MKLSNLILYIAILLANACTGGSQKAQAQNFSLDAVAFAEKINELPEVTVLDVRTPGEFADGHLINAKNYDWNGNSFDQQISTLSKEKPVFVYCLSGARSHAAASKMRSMGFKEVYELAGGIMKWRAAGLPEENTANPGMTKDDYDKLLNTDKKVLIDFYADWCGPCKKMAPYLEEMKSEMGETVDIVRINADKNQGIAKVLHVDALPTLLLYKNGEVVWQQTGFITKEDLVRVIESK